MTLPRKGKAEKTSRNPELSRKRIINAALKEFATRGFAGARVDGIARRAQINKRMLYHYFGDKEGLFLAVLREKISERKAWLAGAPENPFETLPIWFDLMRQDPDWIRLLQWEALHWKDRRVIDETRRKQSFAAAISRVRRLQEAGEVPGDLDPAQLLISMLALTVYPFAFPHLARLATGLRVSDPRFVRQRHDFLVRFAAYFQRPRSRGADVPRQTGPQN